jgi:hypothetical protein
MDKYLTIFESHSQYVEPEVRPNVSYCIQEDEVHYNSIPIMTVRYNVTDATNPTQLYYYISEGDTTAVTGALMFNKVVIDGVETSIADLDAAEGKYQLSVGEHTVKYTLKDPTSIVAHTFDNCRSLISVTIPNSVITIGDYAFNNCRGLSLIIFNSVITIGSYAFLNCHGLISVTIPNSVTTIGERAFMYCYGLTSVTIPNSVTTIGDHAFYDCHNLTSVNIPNSVTNIENGAFAYCRSLASVTIPNSVTSIGNEVFTVCESLTSVIIPNSVTTIGSHAFRGCDNLTSIIIPNSVTSIGGSAFWQCSNLTSVTIGNSVTSIGNSAFKSCSNLTNIISLATIAPTIGSETFEYINTGGTLYVPTGSTGYDVWMGTGRYYLGAYNWTKVEQ